jgi:hypothetical protein
MRKIKYLFLFFLLASAGVAVLLKVGFFQKEDLLQNPLAKRCAECHGKISREWEKSRHFLAWTSEGYKKETENHKKIKCLGCHIPKEISFTEKPTPRDFHLDDGVSCLACHFRDGAMHGPYQVFSPPHPSKREAVYHQSAACKGCHSRSFKELQETGSSRTCQECHMPRRKEKMIDKFPYDLLPIHFEVDVGDHSTPVLTLTEKDLRFEVHAVGNKLEAVLENMGIPHNLPTAENGDPRLYLEVEFFSRDLLLGQEKTIFAPQLETALPFAKEWKGEYPLPGNCDKAKFSLLLRRSWKEEKELLAVREWKL